MIENSSQKNEDGFMESTNEILDPNEPNRNDLTTEGYNNYNEDEKEMESLVSAALGARLPPIAMRIIDTLKAYGEKAITHILRIANRHPSPRVRLYALQAIRDLKKQS